MVVLLKKIHVPDRYIPKYISKKEQQRQKQNLIKSRKAYKNKKYINRPTLKTYKNKSSKHLKRLYEIYGLDNLKPTKQMSIKTGCKQTALKKIVQKGEGAYYSSGSRPNQTPQSWGYARLGSAITGDKASVVDYKILQNGCKPSSKALKLATRKKNQK